MAQVPNFHDPERLCTPALPTPGTLSGPALALTKAIAAETGRSPTPSIYTVLTQMTRRHWSGPRCSLWEPFVAGAIVRIAEFASAFFAAPTIEASLAVVGQAPSAGAGEPLTETERIAITLLTQTALRRVRPMLREDYLGSLLGFTADTTLNHQLDAAEKWLAEKDVPLPWAALALAAHFTNSTKREEVFCFGLPPFNRLTRAFTAAAERQGVTTWEGALQAAHAFWDNSRGDILLHLLVVEYCDRLDREAKPDRPAPEQAPVMPLQPSLHQLEARLAEAERVIAERDARGEELRRQASAAHREAAEARQSRDRALDRVRVLESECEALRSAVALRPAEPPDQPAPVRSTVPAPEDSPAPEPSTSAPSAAAIRAALAGRTVYLFTGVERATARQAMATSLESYGAHCEVFDGNRLSQLGPSRYHPEALVVIEISHLCHNACDAVAERARASGAALFLVKASPASLARRITARLLATRRAA
ncbi:MAG: hypothetical protein ABI742_10830 [Gemmatimonadota bacterium]